MTRKQVLDRCYTARTSLDIEAAKEARSNWLVKHPDDLAVRDMGEMLSMLEDAIRFIDEGHAELPLPNIETRIAKAS